MDCPNLLGLLVKCKPVLVLQANQIRVMLQDDSEITLTLIDCFPPPLMRNGDGFIAENPQGMEAYRLACDALNDLKTPWIRCWIPVPEYAREWFRNLKPGSMQAGHLWISPKLTLNELLVNTGNATNVQPKPGSPYYDGASLNDDL